MRALTQRWVAWLDLAAIVLTLGWALVLPIVIMVPHNDEWLRLNYLADHSVVNWTIHHARTWVVRPTSELIMGFAALPNTRPALADSFNAQAFLTRFHWMYVVMVVGCFALLYANAAALAGRLRALPQLALLAALLLVCMLTADGLGYAFFWVDGYANVVMPFLLLTCGLVLLTGTRSARIAGVGCLLLAALGHEVMCIFAVGVSLLVVALHRRSCWTSALHAGLIVVGAAILWAQTFSAGPEIRSATYVAKTGIRYNWQGAWNALSFIDPVRAGLAYLATLLLIAIQRERLGATLERACRDARTARAFWLLLPLGTLVTSTLPLMSVGLKKATVIVGAYSVATQLFVILAAALSYPALSSLLEPLVRGYRARVGSLLPVLALVALPSRNIALYITLATTLPELRRQAAAYTEGLFAAHKRAHVTRPCHPFIKPASSMSERNAAQYFKLARVKEKDCKL